MINNILVVKIINNYLGNRNEKLALRCRSTSYTVNLSKVITITRLSTSCIRYKVIKGKKNKNAMRKKMENDDKISIRRNSRFIFFLNPYSFIIKWNYNSLSMDKVNEEKEKKEEIFKNKKSPHSFTYKIYLKKKERKIIPYQE